MPDSAAVTAIVERQGDPATVAWAHEGQGTLAALPDPQLAIAAAAALGNVRALQSVTAPKDLKKAAAAALHKLRSRGVQVLEPVAPRAFTLAKEDNVLPSRAFLSLPDQEGDVELLLTTSDATGNCAIGTILGTGGVTETRHAHLGRGELRDLWKRAEGRQASVEIPFSVGLHYADQAFSGAADKHDWTHFLEHVPAAQLQAARILDPLASAPAQVDEGEPDRWLAPLKVLDHEVLKQAASHIAQLVTSGAIEGEAALDEKLEPIYAAAADAALEEGSRSGLARAADLAAIALTFHGQPLAAAKVAAQAEAATSGAPGSSIDGVALLVRAVLLSSVQGVLYDRLTRVDEQLQQANEGASTEPASTEPASAEPASAEE